MRPRLRDDVHFVPLPADRGVSVTPGWAPDRGFVMPGRNTWAQLQRLGPLLDGEHEEGALRGGPQGPRPWVTALLDQLERGDALRDASDDAPHCLSRCVRSAYASVIAYLHTRGDSPEHRFELYRELRPQVVGPPVLAVALAAALLATGVRDVSVVLVTSDRSAARTARQVLDTVVEQDDDRVLQIAVTLCPAPAEDRPVLVVVDGGEAGAWWSGDAFGAGRPALGWAFVGVGHATIPAVGQVPEPPPAREPRPGARPRCCTSAAASLVGAQLAAAVLHHVAEVDDPASYPVEVDLATLSVSSGPAAGR